MKHLGQQEELQPPSEMAVLLSLAAMLAELPAHNVCSVMTHLQSTVLEAHGLHVPLASLELTNERPVV